MDVIRCVYLPTSFSFPGGKTELYLVVSQIQRYSILTWSLFYPAAYFFLWNFSGVAAGNNEVYNDALIIKRTAAW